MTRKSNCNRSHSASYKNMNPESKSEMSDVDISVIKAVNLSAVHISHPRRPSSPFPSTSHNIMGILGVTHETFFKNPNARMCTLSYMLVEVRSK